MQKEKLLCPWGKGVCTKEELDNCLTNGDEMLDGKSVTAWYKAKQFLDF